MIYSIGHGNKRIGLFIEELKSFEIKYLIDIRSNPHSRFNPQFNQAALRDSLKNVGIEYVFMGDRLGGLPSDKSCYIDGKVDYDIIKNKDFFKQGIQRLITASSKGIDVAIMCSELKPEECHRSKLIGQVLLNADISVQHIISSEKVKGQVDVMNELTKGRGTVDLFGDEINFQSRKRYD